MMMRSLKFEDQWVQEITFSDSLREQHMAKDWSHLNMNWGRIDFWLYSILLPVDPKQAHEWTIEFFKDINLSEQERKLRRELDVLTLNEEPNFKVALDKALRELTELCDRRNELVHGLWSQIADGEFEVQPLKLTTGRLSMVKPIVVNSKYLRDLVKLMSRVIEQCASLGSTTIAHRELRKIDRQLPFARSKA
jgi:hypothetical protein